MERNKPYVTSHRGLRPFEPGIDPRNYPLLTPSESARYCEALAKQHYENFIVVSLFIPKEYRQHLYNLYAFCRWADDLGDEVEDPRLALQLLDWWEGELIACFEGKPSHPVYVALAETVKTFDLPLQPFRDLISAFRQDQQVHRYATFDQLLDYCRRSANPVGRLYLWIFGYREEEYFRLSDATCTALQLTNFWQDVVEDLARGRIYIPREDMEYFGYTEEDLLAHIYNPAFRRLMAFEVERTRGLFYEGLKLKDRVSGRIRSDVEMFNRAGLEVLDLLERQSYNVFLRRPVMSRVRKSWLMLRWMLRRFVG